MIATAVAAGTRTILLREKDLPAEERATLAKALADLLAPVDGTLLVAGDARLAEAVGAPGVHLAATDPVPAALPRTAGHSGSAGVGLPAGVSEPPASRDGWRDRARTDVMNTGDLVLGRSCHSVGELRAAQTEGVAYVTFSPVRATSSKPGYGPALGLEGFAEGVAAVPGLPVYALGGIEPGRAADCRAAGAAGVAVMGAVMRAADPGSVARHLLTELRAGDPAPTGGAGGWAAP